MATQNYVTDRKKSSSSDEDKNAFCNEKTFQVQFLFSTAHEFAELLNHISAPQAEMSVAGSRVHARAPHFGHLCVLEPSAAVAGPCRWATTCAHLYQHSRKYLAFPVCRTVPAGEQYPHVTMRYTHLEQRALLAATNAVSGFLDAATAGADAPEQGGKPV